MKFNMGCGRRKLSGYVNVDASFECEPDELFDLEHTPWPWPDGCAEEVKFIHSLEHMGAQPKVFLGIIRELYRIAAPDCRIEVKVPHPRHDNFLSDPTHVRPVTADTWRLFDLSLNDAAIAAGGSNSPFARYLGVDFELLTYTLTLDEPYWRDFQSGKLSEAEVDRLTKEANNVVRELSFVLRARKPTASRSG